MSSGNPAPNKSGYSAWKNQVSRPSANNGQASTSAPLNSNSSNWRHRPRPNPQLNQNTSANDLVGNMQTLSLARPVTAVPGFQLFPTLAAELRVKIWVAACEEERILEVVLDRAGGNEEHAYFRISPACNRPPGVLHANKESRVEALKFYKPIYFPNLQGSDEVTYFNKAKDIIYFGEKTCLNSMVRFFNRCFYQNFEIRRVAVVCSGQLTQCCDFDDDPDGWGVSDQHAIDMENAVFGGATPMQVLHGMDEAVAGNQLIPGGRFLRDIKFIVKTDLMQFKDGRQVTPNLSFRPAVGNGLTKGQGQLKNNLTLAIDRVLRGEGVLNTGVNKWLGGSMPRFSFASFAPPTDPGKVHDALVIPVKGVEKLNGNNWAFIQNLEKKTGCKILVCKKEYPVQPTIEIGIHGVRAKVLEAKKAINEQLQAKIFNNQSRGGYRGRGGYNNRGGSTSTSRGGSNSGNRGGNGSRGGHSNGVGPNEIW